MYTKYLVFGTVSVPREVAPMSDSGLDCSRSIEWEVDSRGKAFDLLDTLRDLHPSVNWCVIVETVDREVLTDLLAPGTGPHNPV
jgi:hypothetical protein